MRTRLAYLVSNGTPNNNRLGLGVQNSKSEKCDPTNSYVHDNTYLFVS